MAWAVALSALPAGRATKQTDCHPPATEIEAADYGA